MSPRAGRLLFFGILILGAVLRFTHVRWDEEAHLHPDERFISMVEERLARPAGISEYFDSARSPLNPYNRGFGSFVYGTLPIYLTRAIGSLVGKTGYGGAYAVGRALSGFFDLITVWLVYLIARRFSGRGTALLASGFLAFCPLGIQLSHYWAVDTFLVTFTAAALLGCVRHAQGRSGLLGDAATGIAIGLAIACKITALALFGPAALAVAARQLSDGLPRGVSSWSRSLGRGALRFAILGAVAVVAVRVGLPYAFRGPSPFSLRLDPRWIEDIRRLSEQARTFSGFPPAFQWADRGLLYPVQNFVLWGASPFFGLAALAGLLWGAVHSIRRRVWSLIPIWVHALFLLAYHGLGLVKAMRYWYPAYPGLAVLAALFLTALARRLQDARGLLPRLARATPALALVGTMAAGFAFSRIYTRPVTRVAASDWIYQHVAPSRFAGESWDDGLPIPRPGGDGGAYHGPVLPLFDPDGREKTLTLLAALSEADWIAVTSGRVYSNVTRLPDVFPMTIAYYRALFEGRLGFDLVADFTSYPSLGPLRFNDDAAEEQFTVYDHPRVLLLRKRKDFSRERVRQILLAPLATTPPTIAEWEKWPRSKRRVTAPVRPDLNKTTLVPLKAEAPEETVSSWWAALVFYLAVSATGLFAFPLLWMMLPRLPDRGAGIARVFGTAAATYLLALMVSLRVLANGRWAALLSLLLLAAAGSLIFASFRRRILVFCREERSRLLQGELVFLAGFALFSGLRALNPEIFWGEKPMDFSILNILVRTPSLPPSDPWFAGAPLGYYYFGQEMIAFLSLATGLSTRYTFNLAFGLIGGATLQGAFTLLRNWTGSLRAAVAGAAFTTLLGNLAGLREWLVNQPVAARLKHLPASQNHHLDWHYFWATSRVIQDTINEYPFWSLLFADLHAHVLAFPLFLLVATVSLQFVRCHAEFASTSLERGATAALLGFCVAAQALTNAWDVPLLAGLVLLVGLVSAFPRSRLSKTSILRALMSLTITASCALAFILPLWIRGGGAPGHGRTGEAAARGVDILTVFGLFVFLLVAWWVTAARRRLSDWGMSGRVTTTALTALSVCLALLAVLTPTAFCVVCIFLFLVAAVANRGPAENRLACGFAATGFFLIFFTERFYIYDRMNTFFKMYLEAWFVLAIAAAALLFRSDQSGGFARWGIPLRAAFAALLALALFTTVTAGQGAIDRTTSPSAQEQGRTTGLRRFIPGRGPTLDGLRYLEEKRPGEYRAVLWLRRAIRGTPVILEAQGPPYQEFGRMSMFTGLPTVLGWEYHVQQRGNPPPEIEARKEAVRLIYTTPKSSLAEVPLRRYHVAYVCVGWLERETYPQTGLAKFDRDRDLFQLVYENREAQIYRVASSETQDVLVPTHEKVVPPAGTPASDTEPEEAPLFTDKPREDVHPFGLMREPRDGAIDDRGRIWIADFGNSRIRVFDSEGGFLGGWGGRGSGTFGLREPSAVAIAGDHVYVADTWNGRIQHDTPAGESRGSVAGLYGPRGVAVAPDGTVWVTDTGNHRVMHYDAELVLLGTFGKNGHAPDQFDGPIGIAVGDSGSVYVADAGNRRIAVLTGDGQLDRTMAFPGWQKPGEPHIEVGAGERLFVTDPEANAVVELDRTGAAIGRWTVDQAGKAFAKPTGLAIDRRRSILYVVNSGSSTVSSIRLPERKAP